MSDPLRRAWPLLSVAALFVAVAYLGSLGGDALDRTDVTMVLNLILVVSLYMFVGNSGVFSFGHIGFMAVGAYTGALLQIPPETKAVLLPDLPGFLASVHLSAVPATLVAGLVTAAFALVLAVPLMRLSGLTASLGTFVVLLIVNVVAKNWQEVTHGTAGISAVPATTTRTGALVWALIALLTAYLFQQSASGLRLRASREDEIAARASGVRVTRERSIAWVLSAFFTGVAGALYASFLGSFNADFFFLGLTSLIVIMLVVGGSTSLSGAVVGTIVISVLAEALRRAETEVDVLGLKEIGFAVAMLAILIVRPAGLTGGRELELPRARRFGPARRES